MQLQVTMSVCFVTYGTARANTPRLLFFLASVTVHRAF